MWRKMGYSSAMPLPPRISRPMRAHSLSNYMHRHFEPKFLPSFFGSVNGCLQCYGQRKAGTVSQRKTEGARMGDKAAREACLGQIERDHLLNRATGVFPSLVGRPPAAHQLVVNFSQVNGDAHGPV